MTLMVDNERTKLLANALDRASTAVFAVGVVTPTVSYVLNLQQVRDSLGIGGMVGFVAISLLSAVGSHLLARSVLGELR